MHPTDDTVRSRTVPHAQTAAAAEIRLHVPMQSTQPRPHPPSTTHTASGMAAEQVGATTHTAREGRPGRWPGLLPPRKPHRHLPTSRTSITVLSRTPRRLPHTDKMHRHRRERAQRPHLRNTCASEPATTTFARHTNANGASYARSVSTNVAHRKTAVHQCTCRGITRLPHSTAQHVCMHAV